MNNFDLSGRSVIEAGWLGLVSGIFSYLGGLFMDHLLDINTVGDALNKSIEIALGTAFGVYFAKKTDILKIPMEQEMSLLKKSAIMATGSLGIGMIMSFITGYRSGQKIAELVYQDIENEA